MEKTRIDVGNDRSACMCQICFVVISDGRFGVRTRFERVRQNFLSFERRTELPVQVQQIGEPEPELCVQFGSVQVRTDFPNRTLTTLLESPREVRIIGGRAPHTTSDSYTSSHP